KTFNAEVEVVGNSGGGSSSGTPYIHYIWVELDDDIDEPGTQIPCNPGGNTHVTVKIIVSDTYGLDAIEDVAVLLMTPPESDWLGFAYTGVVYATLVTSSTEMDAQVIYAAQHGLIPMDVNGWALPEQIQYEWDQNNWAMYRADYELSYCAPAGWWDVEVYVTDTTSETSLHQLHSFEYVECLVLQHDFTSIDYPNMVPGTTQRWQGDTDMGSGGPTLRNLGNVPIDITITSTALMFGQWDITQFDVHWKGVDYEYVADVAFSLPEPLCVCNKEKIDFSVTCPDGYPPGLYTGEMLISITRGDWT
ncbi:hypothetical protein MBGDN05_00730, partial [Thermoplasmatales archaeon SCGC AB-539-N05]